MLVGTPLMLDYVVRPGDTLSEIAQLHGTTVERLVDRNGLHSSGDQVVAGQTLDIPAAHGRTPARPSTGSVDPDARRIVRYTVRPGDTPSALAVRFHAWTAELVERNGAVLHAGEVIEIPVVLAAVAREKRSGGGRAPAPAPAQDPTAAPRPGRTDSPSREHVRRIIVQTARAHGVDPALALAVSWQEAGWQMHHVSHAGAVGAMQVIPGTGRWMSDVLGRDLELTDTRDNITAGVALLEVLLDAAPERVAVAGYYQGLAGVREHGMYRDTKRYVANMMALKERFGG
ncbi:MAG TPA: LysM peptidoglycan-binding domain-containing protein [Nocardioidaceae bacterium]|nr:LysM peptidoglycan-binding domain-containing protein [Nocardioidaceae bacterium]